MSGGRLEPLTPEEWGEEEYAAFGRLLGVPGKRVPRVGSGRTFDPLRFPVSSVLMRHPGLATALMSLNAQLLQKGELDQRLCELIVLHVAATRRSGYVWAEHVPLAARAGLSDDEVQRAAHGPDGFAGRDRLVLEATAELLGDGSASDHTWRRLQEGLGTRAAMEVVVLVGTYAMHIAAFTTWGIEPAEGAPRLP